MNEDLRKIELTNSLVNEVNQNGYGFQNAVFQKLENLYKNKNSVWHFHASELPVHFNGRETKIDLVLQHRETRHFMVIECKRSNPAYSEWCFLKSFEYRRNYKEKLIFNCLELENAQRHFNSVQSNFFSRHSYDISFEIKKEHTKGDPNSKDKRGEVVNKSLEQLMIASNGFGDFLLNNKNILSGTEVNKVAIIPVIVTTATLWVSDDSLKNTELTTGNIDQLNIKQVDWLYFRHYVSDSMSHSVARVQHLSDIGDIFEKKYIRTVAIVNVAGIEKFLEESFEYI